MRQRQLTIATLFQVARARWRIVLAPLLICIVLALLAAVIMPTRYQTSATLILESDDDSGLLAGAAGSLSGLASLAGVNLGGSNNKAATLTKLRSRDLSVRVLQKYNLIPYLYPRRWDAATGRWRPGAKIPKLQEAYERWSSRFFDIKEDTLGGFFTLTINAPTARQSREWATEFLKEADADFRSSAIADAERNIQFLTDQMRSQQQVEMHNAAGVLMVRELKREMSAKGNAHYAFRVIDPPFEPFERHQPKIGLLLALGVLLGLLASAGLAALMSAMRPQPV